MLRRTFEGCDEPVPAELHTTQGECVFSSIPGDGEGAENEDAAGVWELRDGAIVLALADGMGGGPAGGEAAALAMRCLHERFDVWRDSEAVRPLILDAFEEANEALCAEGRGAGTTLVVVEVVDGLLRTYHAGDSGALVVGQRGRVRHETIPHSPTGYAVAAGVMEQNEVHDHDDRHYLSNCLGSAEMRIEVGPKIELAALDTVVLASDGILDNVRRDELLEKVRKGALPVAAGQVVDASQAAIEGRGPIVGHPDDATLLVYRAGSSASPTGQKR